MNTRLDVLVIESHRGVADTAIETLEAAGHQVHRCFDADNHSWFCRAVHDPDDCPLDSGIDVALVVRAGVWPRPTPLETGVSCAIRAGIPLAEHGPAALDPFEPWLTHRVDSDIAEDVTMTATNGYEDLQHAIVDRIRTVIADRRTADSIGCWLERQGQTLVVHLDGPEVDERVRRAISVRVLDAVWSSGRTHGPVDVSYHPVREPTRTPQ